MTICRNYLPEDPFARIHKKMIDDPSISWKAKGILCYAFSKPENWIFYQKEIESHAIDGKDSLKAGIEELQKAGYLHRRKKNSRETGKIEYEWCWFAIPISSDEFQKSYPEAEKPALVKPTLVKPAPTNNDSENKTYVSKVIESASPKSLPLSKERKVSGFSGKSKDFFMSLDNEQRRVLEEVEETAQIDGETIKRTDLTFWILKLENGGSKRVEEVLHLYKHKKKSGGHIKSMAAFMRHALNKGLRMPSEQELENKLYAEECSRKHRFVRPLQKYVVISTGRELYYWVSDFKEKLDSYIEFLKDIE